MICTNCGAHLMETDQFCPKCGTKAIRDLRCPDCGALLRDGVKFCPKCGNSVDRNSNMHRNFDDTLDIPIDAIERNILSETAAEIKADRSAGSAPRKTVSGSSSAHSPSEKSTVSRSSSSKSTSSHNQVQNAPVKKKASNPEPPVKKKASNPEPPVRKKASNPEPPRRKKAVYREEDWEEEDWEDDDWDEEEEDWDEDDEGGVDFITVMTAVVGCVLLVVVAVLGFHLYRQYVPKDYDKVAEEGQEEQEQDQGDAQEDGQGPSGVEDRETYTLKVIHNVNVRDNPSTSGTNVLKVAQEGETYTSYGSPDGGEWYEILLEDGSTGYVFHEYITIE